MIRSRLSASLASTLVLAACAFDPGARPDGPPPPVSIAGTVHGLSGATVVAIEPWSGRIWAQAPLGVAGFRLDARPGPGPMALLVEARGPSYRASWAVVRPDGGAAVGIDLTPGTTLAVLTLYALAAPDLAFDPSDRAARRSLHVANLALRLPEPAMLSNGLDRLASDGAAEGSDPASALAVRARALAAPIAVRAAQLTGALAPDPPAASALHAALLVRVAARAAAAPPGEPIPDVVARALAVPDAWIAAGARTAERRAAGQAVPTPAPAPRMRDLPVAPPAPGAFDAESPDVKESPAVWDAPP